LQTSSWKKAARLLERTTQRMGFPFNPHLLTAIDLHFSRARRRAELVGSALSFSTMFQRIAPP
jgi:hypothetical protein